MVKYFILIQLLSISTFTNSLGQVITPKDSTSNKSGIIVDPLYPIRAFKRIEIQPIYLPDSLGGKNLNIHIYLDVWVDSNAAILAINPTLIVLYDKDTRKKVAAYQDPNNLTAKWENPTLEVQRYINWISKVFPRSFRFKRLKGPPPPCCKYIPVKAKNFIPLRITVN